MNKAQHMFPYDEKYDYICKIYDINNKLIYEKEIRANIYNGNTINQNINDIEKLYEKRFLEEKSSGNIKLYYIDSNNKETLIYERQFKEKDHIDFVKYYKSNGKIMYDGQAKNGKIHGYGKFYNPFTEKLLYVGYFKQLKYHGEGELYDPIDGTLLYEGSFIDDKYHGYGKIYKNGILCYEGEFKEHFTHGHGKKYDDVTGILIYEGGIRNEYYNGKGKLYDKETGNLLYEGQFINGLYYGNGKLYDTTTGELIYEGKFKNGNILYKKK